MVYVAVEKVKGNFPECRGGDMSKHACDKGIVANEPELQHEGNQLSQGGFSNVVGYYDL